MAMSGLIPLARHPYFAPGLDAGGDFYADPSVNSIVKNLGAQCRLCKRKRQLVPYVKSVTLKDGMRTHGNRDLQITGRTAVCTRIALSPYADDLPVVNPRGDIDPDG